MADYAAVRLRSAGLRPALGDQSKVHATFSTIFAHRRFTTR